jgi:hypothetical protein
MRRHPVSAALVAAVAAISSALATGDEPKPIDYQRQIKPLLSSHCYACHGPDENQRQAELRLDLGDAALDKAIVAGDAAASPLLARVTSTDPDEQMPPPDSKKPVLKADEVELLRRWIDEGAKFTEHWSYVPPKRPAVPETPDAAWPRGAIDRFVAAAQAEHGLSPAAEADRRTLIRRLAFDLTGLPPSPEEVEAFVADERPEAYAELVGRLLDSPHYGERMAMWWLDLVRFADTNGIHGDNHRELSPYRDYVIQAFNDNKPFDRFTIEQLAGDLLPQATTWDRVASGYNRLLMTTQEGGAQAKEYLAKYSADRVRNASVVWLASTLGCAECHDHKYDPFASRDFYRFASFFADIQELAVGDQPAVPVLFAEDEARLAALDGRIAELRGQLDAPTPELAAAQATWEAAAGSALAAQGESWTVVRPDRPAAESGTTLTVQEDASVLASGENPANEVFTVELVTDLEGITGLRLEALTDATLSEGGLSRSGGNFVLTGIEVEVRSLDDIEPRRIAITSGAADYSQQGFPIEHAFDDQPGTGWAVDGQARKEGRQAVLVFGELVTGGPGTTITVRLRHQSQFAGHTIGRFRLSLSTSTAPTLMGAGIPPDVLAALAVPADARTAEQAARLAAHYRSIAPALQPARDELAAAQAQRQSVVDTAPKTLVSMSGDLRPIRILPRGNWLDETGEIVTPAVPGFFPAAEVEGRATRLDLARWLVARDNPLVARVLVNRLWKLCFGRGIVRTLDDFGAQGAPPTHPELLDWLAVELIDSGWDVKHMLRLMVDSSAYRQASTVFPAQRQSDPGNQWLARQERFRLDAEMIRDNALAASGLLVPTVGGPSARPYQPAGYWRYLNFPPREWQADSGAGLYRRGLYTYWCRTFLHPSLLAFDAPTREECAVDRPRSSTPLQALVLLNDPTYVEAARVLAERIVREGGATADERLRWTYRRVLARGPTDQELLVLASLVEKHLARYAADPQAAQGLISTGATPPPADLDAAELAAWTNVARVVLNLHETNTRP